MNTSLAVHPGRPDPSVCNIISAKAPVSDHASVSDSHRLNRAHMLAWLALVVYHQPHLSQDQQAKRDQFLDGALRELEVEDIINHLPAWRTADQGQTDQLRARLYQRQSYLRQQQNWSVNNLLGARPQVSHR